MNGNFKNLLAIMAIAIIFALSSCRGESENPDVNPADLIPKKHDTAVLLVTFGSTYDLPKATYAKQEGFFKKEFPNTDLFVSYTSRTIINRMEARNETFLPPQIWLKSFLKKGYKNVYVQSLHVIPGEEYTLLRDAYVKKEYNVQLIDMKSDRNPAVLGDPLLSNDESIRKVAKILVDDFAEALKRGEVVAFMGHGNPEANYITANEKYAQVEKEMQKYAADKYGNGMVYVATVDYEERLFGNYLVEALNKSGAAKKIIHLQPLMTIAGDHASNDMAGEDTEEDGQVIPMEERSWKLQLENMGWTVHTYMKGLGDYDEINQIYLEHLKNAIKEAEKE